MTFVPFSTFSVLGGSTPACGFVKLWRSRRLPCRIIFPDPCPGLSRPGPNFTPSALRSRGGKGKRTRKPSYFRIEADEQNRHACVDAQNHVHVFPPSLGFRFASSLPISGTDDNSTHRKLDIACEQRRNRVGENTVTKGACWEAEDCGARRLLDDDTREVGRAGALSAVSYDGAGMSQRDALAMQESDKRGWCGWRGCRGRCKGCVDLSDECATRRDIYDCWGESRALWMDPLVPQISVAMSTITTAGLAFSRSPSASLCVTFQSTHSSFNHPAVATQ